MPRAARPKIHPVDLADRAAIRAAVGFNVHLRIDPARTVNWPVETLREAVQAAQHIDGKNLAAGRKCLVYAIAASGAETNGAASVVCGSWRLVRTKKRP